MSDGRVKGIAWAVCGWCLVFAAPHLYWAAGGRAGLGAEAAAADAALATPWFAAYNLTTAVLSVAGAVLGVGFARGLPDVARRAARAALGVASVLLLVRGLIGTVGLVVAVAGPGLTSPPVLVAVEGWFLLGGLLFGALYRATK